MIILIYEICLLAQKVERMGFGNEKSDKLPANYRVIYKRFIESAFQQVRYLEA